MHTGTVVAQRTSDLWGSYAIRASYILVSLIDDLSEAARLVIDMSSTSVRLNWLDSIIKKIHEGRELQLHFHKVASLRVEAKETYYSCVNAESLKSGG